MSEDDKKRIVLELDMKELNNIQEKILDIFREEDLTTPEAFYILHNLSWKINLRDYHE